MTLSLLSQENYLSYMFCWFYMYFTKFKAIPCSIPISPGLDDLLENVRLDHLGNRITAIAGVRPDVHLVDRTELDLDDTAGLLLNLRGS